MDELFRGQEAQTQFVREALRPGDLYRPLPKHFNFEEIFCLKKQRTIHNGYFIRWKGKRHTIEKPFRRMMGRPAPALEHFDGRMIIRFEREDLDYRKIAKKEARTKPKIIRRFILPKYNPPPELLWRRLFIAPSQSSPQDRAYSRKKRNVSLPRRGNIHVALTTPYR
ncbi:hypothetical protein D4R89_13220 [bacterium]|nr:MAG: hypothetical protein D4R89_13220 [bacterium]